MYNHTNLTDAERAAIVARETGDDASEVGSA